MSKSSGWTLKVTLQGGITTHTSFINVKVLNHIRDPPNHKRERLDSYESTPSPSTIDDSSREVLDIYEGLTLENRKALLEFGRSLSNGN